MSSPTISHDDDQQSDGTTDADEKEKFPEEEDKEDDESGPINEDKEVEALPIILETPVKIIYQNRDILNLSSNAFGSRPLVQYTVLPENNVNCFFQNRAQYYRLSSTEQTDYPIEKCSCCDFTYPSTQQLNQGPTANEKNALTDSILTFLKSSEHQMSPIMPKRMMNNNTPFGYQLQQQQASQQYHPQSNGFYNNNASYNQPSMNPFINNGSGYGTTLALLNLMNNASRNTASAFQAISNGANNARYYNNNMNNSYGLYKQF